MANVWDFESILRKMCQLFSKRLDERVTPEMVGYETIQLASDEIDYPGIGSDTLPEKVLCHLFICGDWSGYAIVDLNQTKLYAIGTFYGSDYSGN